MEKKLIKHALMNTHGNEVLQQDILIDSYGILQIADEINDVDAQIIEAEGCLVMPGLIDVHVHLRQPGYEDKETIKTGTMAAAHGGFTTIMAMPNVKPVPDRVEVMEAYLNLIKQDAVVHVLPYASITKEEKGKEVVDMHALKQLGILAFSDDGVGVANDEIMMQAMEQSAKEDVLIVAHTEDMNYRLPKACMHEGIRNKELGYLGIPSACEYEQIKRDLMLVEETNAHYHICHMSAKESVELLAAAKEKGLDVSGEVTVHHLLLNELDVQDDANFKMNPPLRGKDDQQALLDGLRNEVIDFIANDHAPHTAVQKAKGMEEAPFGIVSIETAFPLLYTNLVLQGKATLEELIHWMSTAPAQRFHMDRVGELKEGYAADLVLVDLQQERPINVETFYSKGTNTPFANWLCKGWPRLTIVDGAVVYDQNTHKEELL